MMVCCHPSVVVTISLVGSHDHLRVCERERVGRGTAHLLTREISVVDGSEETTKHADVLFMKIFLEGPEQERLSNVACVHTNKKIVS
jgi:hypothetical protein